MDRQLKQRLVGASVVVALAVIIVPELVKQKPQQSETEGVNALSEIPPRPVIAEQAGQSAGQSTMIILPGGQPAQQPEAIGTDSGVEFIGADDSTEPGDIVMPPGSSGEIVDIEAAELPAGSDDIVADTVFEPISEPVSEPVSESVSESVSGPAPPVRAQTRPEPVPQRLPPDKPVVAAKRAEPKPAPRPQPAPVVPAPTNRASTPAPAPSPSRATTRTSPPVELPAIELISRSQYAAAGSSSQQVSKRPRWMVQAGSFYVAENASMLREKLRQQSFPASLQSAVVDGRTVYRVQVGPHATRAEGERTQARLLREAGINGNIVPVYN